MTADIKLLPLPPLHIAPSVEPVDYPNVAQALMDYARANVAHATEPMKAEIEALRGEVRDAYAAADSKAGWEWKKRAEAAETRAERLAEALRDALECGEDGDWQSARNTIRAALRDHDQEGKDG